MQPVHNQSLWQAALLLSVSISSDLNTGHLTAIIAPVSQLVYH